MIFLSHNYKDKPFVEHIASQLLNIYGEDKVFYDSWSIQPGEGIIDRMNSGLGDAKIFFFFITENSLNSKMVTLEWQNALMKSAQGALKFIPIKCDDSIVPALLTQSLYLDLMSNGVESLLAQMKDMIVNKSTFKPKNTKFSNLSYDYKFNEDNSIILYISAGYFLEAISDCLICFEGNLEEGDVICSMKESMYTAGFHKGVKLTNGSVVDSQFVSVPRGITTKIPMIVSLSKKDGEKLKIKFVLHKVETERWDIIPQKVNSTLNPGHIPGGVWKVNF